MSIQRSAAATRVANSRYTPKLLPRLPRKRLADAGAISNVSSDCLRPVDATSSYALKSDGVIEHSSANYALSPRLVAAAVANDKFRVAGRVLSPGERLRNLQAQEVGHREAHVLRLGNVNVTDTFFVDLDENRQTSCPEHLRSLKQERTCKHIVLARLVEASKR
jgi:hypothetical protein